MPSLSTPPPPPPQFLVGDLGSGNMDMKLKVYKGLLVERRERSNHLSLIQGPSCHLTHPSSTSQRGS